MESIKSLAKNPKNPGTISLNLTGAVNLTFYKVTMIFPVSNSTRPKSKIGSWKFFAYALTGRPTPRRRAVMLFDLAHV